MRKTMREKLAAKLRSGRGASITFALLLFLVCAVIGSVVLAAGTAAAGRISQLAQADGRYYAVTSAAKLFREELDGKSYTIERTKTTIMTTTSYLVGTDGEVVSTDWSGNADDVEEGQEVVVVPTVDSVHYGYAIKEKQDSGDTIIGCLGYDGVSNVDPGNLSWLAETAMKLVFSEIPYTEAGLGEEQWLFTSEDAWTDLINHKDMTVSLGESDGSAEVKVSFTKEENGDLKLTFSDKGEGTEHYSVFFTLSLQNQAFSGMNNDVENVSVETKTNRFAWTASDIRSGS